jgi:protein ImuB
MPRIVSIWLRSWPIARRLRDEQRKSSASADDKLDIRRPLALVAQGTGGARISALNAAAARAGLTQGELLSNARSKVLDLQVRDADPAADAAALEKLGLWCVRYTPTVSAWNEASGADGLFLDVEASSHLFGGEAKLLAELLTRLKGFGLPARLAIASTPGAAWALARYGKEQTAILASGREADALRPLPLAALRLPDEALILARRLGLRRISDVMEKPRAPLAHRFGAALIRRLDQALGHSPEPLPALVPPPVYETRGNFVDPISSAEHIVEAVSRLFTRLSDDLIHDGKGARTLRLMLFRTDGETRHIDVGLAAPTRDTAHITRLIELRLDRVADDLDAGLGFEAMGLHVLTAEPLTEQQAALSTQGDGPASDGLATLIDRLEQRLGSGSVVKLTPRESHIPERAVVRSAASDGPALRFDSTNSPLAPRPLFLFERPEEAHVLALIPEGPPRQFRWRGVLHQIVSSEGPERIAPEWWRRDANTALERDYYAVEDENGWRFWLYRDGHYGEGTTPRWFLQGVFA